MVNNFKGIKEKLSKKILWEGSPVAQNSVARADWLEALLEAVTDAVFIYNEKLDVVHVNTAAYNLLGLDKDSKFFTLPVKERIEQLGLPDPDGSPLTEESHPVYHILRGEVFSGNKMYNLRLRNSKGQEIEVSISGAPLYDKTQHIRGAIMICRDVTEERKLERRTQDALQALMQLSGLVISTPLSGSNSRKATYKVVQKLLEVARRMLECDRAAFIVIKEDESLEFLDIQGVEEADKQRYMELIKTTHLRDFYTEEQTASLKQGKMVILNTRMFLTADRARDVSAQDTYLGAPILVGESLFGIISVNYIFQHKYPLEEESTLLAAVAQLAAVISAREHFLHETGKAHVRQISLEETNKQMDEFLSMTSHELRTPLATIKGNAQLAKRQIKKLFLKQEVEAESEVGKRLDGIMGILEKVEEQSDVQNRLVGDLLDVSRIQAGKFELQIHETEIGKLVQSVVEAHKQMDKQRNFRFQPLMVEEEVWCLIDADRIAQVVNNYLSNAEKFSPLDTAITVSMWLENGKISVKVRDEGIGLTKEEQEKIWKRFYQSKDKRFQGSKGLGLGLYICQTIVLQHHGEMGVESEEGKGSTFWFSIPACKEGKEAE